MTEQELLDEIARIEKEKEEFVKNAEKQLIAYDGALQGLRMLKERYFTNATDSSVNNSTAT